MRSPLAVVLASFALCASSCFLAPVEQVVGSFDSGVDGGAADAGQPLDAGPDGDATCDQSQCLPPTYVLSRTGVSQLALDGDAVIALGSMYGNGLARLELSTGATTVLQYDQSNPLDASGSLRVSGGWVYLMTTWAGEMFGIPARVRLSDGVMETLADSSQASGSPTQRGADVDATDYVYGNLNGLQRVRVADLPGGPASLLVALPPLEGVRDVRLSPTHVWWVSSTGLHRVTRSGGAAESLASGDFERVRLAGEVAWVSGPAGLSRYEGAALTSVLAGNVRDFALARGTAFVAQQVGTRVRVVALDGTPHFEEDVGTTNPVSLRLEVNDSRIVFGTPTHLVVVSNRVDLGACDCAAPPFRLPAAVASCERALCGAPVIRSEGLAGGDFVGASLLGAFRAPGDSSQQLKKVTGAVALGFDLQSPSANVVADATTVFNLANGGLYAVDLVSGTSRLVVDGVYGPYRYGSSTAPVLQLDATHVYGLSSSGSIFRVARGGGALEEVLPDQPFVDGLRLDATHVYVSSNNRLVRVAKTGGTPEVLATGLWGGAGFDLSGGHAWFFTARGLERVRTGGGFKTLVLRHEQLGDVAFTHLHVQGREAVMVTPIPGSGSERLIRVDLATLARETLLSLPNNSTSFGVVITPTGYALASSDQTRFQLRDCCP